jgi:hypothetical protein
VPAVCTHTNKWLHENCMPKKKKIQTYTSKTWHAIRIEHSETWHVIRTHRNKSLTNFFCRSSLTCVYMWSCVQYTYKSQFYLIKKHISTVYIISKMEVFYIHRLISLSHIVHTHTHLIAFIYLTIQKLILNLNKWLFFTG